MTTMNPVVENWSGRRVWVIGASSGIGAAFAQRMAKAGAQVLISARRASQLAEIAQIAPTIQTLPFDAADALAWQPAYAAAVERLGGGIDLVAFVAARYEPQRAWEIDPESAQRSFDLNVVSVYRGLSQVLPAMLARGSGAIGVVASVSGYTGLPQATVYGATKAALINLAESLYFDLAPKGISVYLFNPGFVETPMTAVNDFAMPDIISPDEAAESMLQGMTDGDFEIRFPKRFTGRLWWLSRLPYRWRFPLLHKATRL